MSLIKIPGKEAISVISCDLHYFHLKKPDKRGEYGKNHFSLFVQNGIVVMTAHGSKQKHLGKPIKEVEAQYQGEFFKEII